MTFRRTRNERALNLYGFTPKIQMVPYSIAMRSSGVFLEHVEILYWGIFSKIVKRIYQSIIFSKNIRDR